MGKYLGLKKGGLYSGMVRFVRRSETGSPLYMYYIFHDTCIITDWYLLSNKWSVENPKFLFVVVNAILVQIFFGYQYVNKAVEPLPAVELYWLLIYFNETKLIIATH